MMHESEDRKRVETQRQQVRQHKPPQDLVSESWTTVTVLCITQRSYQRCNPNGSALYRALSKQ
jgi:hypothetical protein